jgi:hypothetical protein
MDYNQKLLSSDGLDFQEEQGEDSEGYLDNDL